ncbi:MAG: hypothetical protein IPM35_10165 [Myxococcales bacterium]|nr:hypothetical protein [Myxococcales bacterium]
MITTQQRRGALHMRALREVRTQMPGEQYDRQFDLARGATSLVLAAAPPQGAPDPAAHGIDAEALAKEFSERFGLDADRAKAIVARVVSELSTQAWAEDAAERAKPKGGQENAADLSKAGGLGSLSVVATMQDHGRPGVGRGPASGSQAPGAGALRSRRPRCSTCARSPAGT